MLYRDEDNTQGDELPSKKQQMQNHLHSINCYSFSEDIALCDIILPICSEGVTAPENSQYIDWGKVFDEECDQNERFDNIIRISLAYKKPHPSMDEAEIKSFEIYINKVLEQFKERWLYDLFCPTQQNDSSEWNFISKISDETEYSFYNQCILYYKLKHNTNCISISEHEKITGILSEYNMPFPTFKRKVRKTGIYQLVNSIFNLATSGLLSGGRALKDFIYPNKGLSIFVETVLHPETILSLINKNHDIDIAANPRQEGQDAIQYTITPKSNANVLTLLKVVLINIGEKKYACCYGSKRRKRKYCT